VSALLSNISHIADTEDFIFFISREKGWISPFNVPNVATLYYHVLVYAVMKQFNMCTHAVDRWL
jgi:hypothetical protein